MQRTHLLFRVFARNRIHSNWVIGERLIMMIYKGVGRVWGNQHRIGWYHTISNGEEPSLSWAGSDKKKEVFHGPRERLRRGGLPGRSCGLP